MNNLEEIWRPVVGYEDILEVSNLGRVRKKARPGTRKKEIPAKLLKMRPGSNYLDTSIGGAHILLLMPELVADAFIPLPAGTVRSDMTAITSYTKFVFSVDNIIWVDKCLVNPVTRGLYTEMKTPKRLEIPDESQIKKDENAIVQLRQNGEFVRRYIDIDEVLEVHPLWDFADILMCLTGHFPDAYGWRWKYEYIYEKSDDFLKKSAEKFAR